MIVQINNLDFINTSEAYSKLGFWGVDSLIIPYINVQLLSGNSLMAGSCFVKYSYFVFREVIEVNEDNGWRQLFVRANSNSRPDDNKLIDEDILTGNWKNKGGTQLNIKCNSAELYIENALLVDEKRPFIPYDTPNYAQNMSQDEVDIFFEYKRMPLYLKGILDNSINS